MHDSTCTLFNSNRSFGHMILILEMHHLQICNNKSLCCSVIENVLNIAWLTALMHALKIN